MRTARTIKTRREEANTIFFFSWCTPSPKSFLNDEIDGMLFLKKNYRLDALLTKAANLAPA
jgi:hypothetical protein